MKRRKSDIGAIEINPKIISGKPVFSGTRIPVELVLEFLANNWKVKKILSEYPSLQQKDIQAAIVYAAKRVKNEELHFYTESQHRKHVVTA